MGRDRSRSRSRSRERRRRSRSRDRKRSRERQRSRDRREPKKEVKKEEDFDRRQDAARERRRRENRNDVKREDVKTERNSPQPGSSNPFAEQLREFSEREWGLQGGKGEGQPAETKPKEKPNLGLSGALTAETNTYKGVVIKYSEPPEAKIPKKRWRFYPFKGDDMLKIIYLHRQSAYLVGRLSHVCEIPVEHPSCSKQHAAIQFRAVKITKSSGRDVLSIRPYVIDLESSNGTYLNNQRIEPKRYYEMREKDVLKFGYSTREYVLLHEKTDTSEVHVSSSEDEVSEDEE